MRTKKYYITLVIFLILAQNNTLFCQSLPLWNNVTKQYKSTIPTRSVVPGAMVDINGDLINDLLIMDKGHLAKIVYSKGKHFGLVLHDSLRTTPSGREWTMTAGDFNNNGWIQFITAGENNNATILSTENSKLIKSPLFSRVYAQASNAVDINNDGWLDYFMCNDDGPNLTYLNNGFGTLRLANVIDFRKDDFTDGSGNYGSIWADINNDLRPDLILSKCRAGVDDPTDPRRVNRVYINQGDQIFTEEGQQLGLNSGNQSWVTAIGDLDNDGWLDAFVINHYAPHELMKNNEGKNFSKVDLSHPLSSFAFQAVMTDFDNDGWLDILLVGVEGDILLHNKGDFNFDIIRNTFSPYRVRSMTVGDLNDDGFVDVHGHINEPINIVGLADDQVFLNRKNNNHFVKISLEGHISNKSGIGSRLELYGPWGLQIRYVYGGESYGICNPLQQHFGLGSYKSIDSLVVLWPSGIRDVFVDLDADFTYLAQENKCITSQINIVEDPLIYKNENLTLTAPSGYSTYLWNNSETTASISVADGDYFVIMADSAGCKTYSKPINVVPGCLQQGQKLWSQPKTIRLCKGEIEEIFPVNGSSYIWSDGSTTQNNIIASDGWHSLTLTDYCNVTHIDSIQIIVFDPEASIIGVTNDTISPFSRAVFTSSSEETLWFGDIDLINPIHKGRVFQTDVLSETSKFHTQGFVTTDFDMSKVGETQFPTSNFYGANSTFGDLIFSVESRCRLHSVKVNTDTKGIRRIEIKNADKEIVFQKDVDIPEGISKVILDVDLEPSLFYTISTNINVNFQNLGHISPRLVRTFQNTSYPYSIDAIINILNTSSGPIYYYYFYDWEIMHDFSQCYSDIKEIYAVVDSTNSVVTPQKSHSITCYPNPANNYLNIFSTEAVKKASILDMFGRTIETVVGEDLKSINVGNLSTGYYIILCETMQSKQYLKFIIQR